MTYVPEKVLMKGNEAIAESAIRAGCRCFFGYPITPQTEVAAYMADPSAELSDQELDRLRDLVEKARTKGR